MTVARQLQELIMLVEGRLPEMLAAQQAYDARQA